MQEMKNNYKQQLAGLERDGLQLNVGWPIGFACSRWQLQTEQTTNLSRQK